MYKTIGEATLFIERLIPKIQGAKCAIWIAPPFTAIASCAKKTEGAGIIIGGQNMSDAEEGAFTGEISAKMLKEAGSAFVILGHSERRSYFQETNEFIQAKVKQALLHEICPILCIGESEGERERGESEKVLHKQLSGCLAGLSAEEMEKVVIAYEPIWAIGTGKSATPEIAQEAHAAIRKEIKRKWNDRLAKNLSILYGGSVKPNNIKNLLKQPDIDGALIGGASLEVEAFADMVIQGSTP